MFHDTPFCAPVTSCFQVADEPQPTISESQERRHIPQTWESDPVRHPAQLPLRQTVPHLQLPDFPSGVRSYGYRESVRCKAFAQHPRQRNLRRRSVLLFRRIFQQFQKLPVAFHIFRLILGHHAAVILMVAKYRILSVLAAEQTVCHR